jgi:hypothetical protein
VSEESKAGKSNLNHRGVEDAEVIVVRSSWNFTDPQSSILVFLCVYTTPDDWLTPVSGGLAPASGSQDHLLSLVNAFIFN